MIPFHSADLSPEEKRDTLDTLRRVVAIPSVKGAPLPQAPFGKETVDALRLMLDLGSEMGFRTKNLDGYAGYIEWGQGEKLIGVLCHLDVVPAASGWSHDPFTLRRENGRLIGRGINDDKGPAVATLYAMKKLRDSGFVPTCRIRLILGLDEESGSECMKYYVEHEELPALGFTPDADFPAIFAEKGILHLAIRGPVSTRFRAKAGERPNMVPAECAITDLKEGRIVTGIGIPAHASIPDAGVNAIDKAILALGTVVAEDVLLRFYFDAVYKDTAGEKLLGECLEDLSGALTLNAGILNMTEEYSELILDIRYPVTLDGGALIARIKNALLPYETLELIVKSHQKPLHKEPNDPLIQALVGVYGNYEDEALEKLNEHEYIAHRAPEPIAIGGGTYARSMPGFCAFGPQFPWEETQAHQADESENEEIMYLLVRLYADALAELTQIV